VPRRGILGSTAHETGYGGVAVESLTALAMPITVAVDSWQLVVRAQAN
jgi:hypothetical protein